MGKGKTKGAGDHIVTPDKQELVRRMMIAGVTRYMIARVLGISEDTFTKHYGDFADAVEPQAAAAVAKSLYEQALQGNTTAQIFYLKCRAGWKDAQKVELTGENGTPLIPVLNVTLNTKKD